MKTDIPESLRSMDIYLIDQLLRDRIPSPARILDAGCGRGRNLTYFMERGDDVYGVDSNPERIEEIREIARELGVNDVERRFQVANVDALPEGLPAFDLVVCNAVLHFARDLAHFRGMVESLVQSLTGGGLFFARLATTKTIERVIHEAAEDPSRERQWFSLPDGSERFLSSLDQLREESERCDLVLADAIKTTNVEDLRSMTTWVAWSRYADDADPDFRYESGQRIELGDRVHLAGIDVSFVVKRIFAPRTKGAEDFNCFETGGVMLQSPPVTPSGGGILEISPFSGLELLDRGERP